MEGHDADGIPEPALSPRVRIVIILRRIPQVPMRKKETTIVKIVLTQAVSMSRK